MKGKFRSRVPKSLAGVWGSLLATSEEHVVDGVTVLREVATELFVSLDTPVSLSCEIMLRYGDLNQLVRKTVDPWSYNDPMKFRDDYQAISFLRKVPFQVEGLDPEAEARRKFAEAEAACGETNRRMRAFLRNPERATDVVRQGYTLAVDA